MRYISVHTVSKWKHACCVSHRWALFVILNMIVAVVLAQESMLITGSSLSTEVVSKDSILSVEVQQQEALCDMNVTIAADPGPPFCVGSVYTLTAIVTGGTAPFEFWWETGDTTQSIDFLVVQNDHITVIVIDAEGCTAQYEIKISPSLLVINMEWADVVCEGDELELSVYFFPPFLGPQIVWSTGETGLYAYITESGMYSVTVTHPDSGCSLTDSAYVEVNYVPSPDPEILGPLTLCAGEEATLTVDGGPFDFILWSTGSQQTTTTVNSPGTYTVLVSDENFCAAYDTLEILPDGILPVLSAPDALCEGQTGTVEVINDTEFSEFIWNTGGTQSSITVSGPGIYTVTATTLGGCSATVSITIEDSGSNIDVSGVVTPLTSCTSPNGAIDITVSPGGTYSFVWSNGQSSEDITDLTSGNYTVTITDVGGCTASASFVVLDNTAPPVLAAIPTAATCGQSNGTIDLSVSPPGSYAFLWSQGTVTEDLVNVSPGTYSVTVTANATGCWATLTITVTDVIIDISISGTITQPSNGQNNGAINITVEPSGNYTFGWSNGSTSEDLTGLAPGTYIVTVTQGSCTETASFILTDDASCDGFSAFIADPIGNVFCIGEELTLTTFTIGGTAPFTYVWSTGGTGSEETIVITGNIDVFVTVTDAEGCTSMSSVHIKPMLWWAIIEVIGDSVCIGESITLQASFSPFTSHLWSTGETTSSIQVNAPGTYTVMVTDDPSGCTSVLEVTPTFLSGLSVEITGSEEICPGQTVTLIAGGGPFDSYSWSPDGQSTSEIEVTEPGTYSVTVSNGTGCDGFDEFVIAPGQVEPPVLSGTEVLCPGQSGQIQITNSGSYVSFLWSTNETTSLITISETGTYSVSVTTAEGCTAEGSFIVSEDPNAPTITSEITPSTCLESNGSINLTISPPGTYTYQWSNGATTEDLLNIQSDVYEVTVTSSGGCSATAIFTVPDNPISISISGTVQANTSCSDANGEIDISIDPPGLYTYAWSNGMTTEDLQSLVSGLYTVTITDANGCSAVDAFAVTDSLTIPVLSVQITSASCGESNGSIDLSVLPESIYSFSWSNGINTEDQSNLAAGNYSVSVTDVNGCLTVDTFIIENHSSGFVVNGVTTPNTSCIAPNGTVDLMITPAGTYEVLWSTGIMAEDLTNLQAGSYSVTVTDEFNCSSSTVFIIQDIAGTPEVTAVVTSDTCNAGEGNIDLSINPPGNISYLWSNGATTEDLLYVASGTYSVNATTAGGCQVLDTFVVQNINNSFSLATMVTSNTACVNPNGAIDLTVTPAAIYTFLWSNGDTTEDLINLDNGLYYVTVTDGNNCASNASYLIADSVPQIVITAEITPATCGSMNGSIALTVNPSPGNQFQWSNGDTRDTVYNLGAGVYSVTVTGTNGCSMVDSFIVPDFDGVLMISAETAANTHCIIPSGAIDLSVSPVGNYTYLWSNGRITEDLNGLPGGVYVVTVIDNNGCSATASFVIEDMTNEPQVVVSVSPAICGEANGGIDLTILPAGSYIYAWSNGGMSEDLQNVSSGTFSVTVTGENGCSTDTTIFVTDTTTSFSVSAITIDNTSCTDANGSVDLSIFPAGNYSFQWSHGATAEDQQFLPPGTFTVTITDISGCAIVESFTIENNAMDLLVSAIITPTSCGEPNASINLDVIPSFGNQYAWSNGNTQEDLDFIPAGVYSVTVTGQNDCTWSSSFTVPGSTGVEIELEAKVVQTGDEITINAEINLPLDALDTIMWLPEDMFQCTKGLCLEQTITAPSNRMEVIVIAIDTNGCIAQQSIYLDAALHPNVFIPNVFSPNNDGVNDEFTVFGNENVERVVELRLFDRWGSVVFTNTDFPVNQSDYGWDGSYRNANMNPDVFVYWALVRFKNGTEELYKGDVTLLR